MGGMSRAAALALTALLLLLPACAGQQRLTAVQALSEQGRDLYSRYRQFLTEDQQDAFLALPTDEARQVYIDKLEIDARLSRYPRRIQDAIWAQEVVTGMDREAVLLTWGKPELRELEQGELARGNEVDRWSYSRGAAGLTQVVFTNGVVTDVAHAEAGR